MKKVYKRYQFWSRNGLEWSSWYEWTGQDCPKWQLKNRLINEYKTVEE